MPRNTKKSSPEHVNQLNEELMELQQKQKVNQKKIDSFLVSQDELQRKVDTIRILLTISEERELLYRHIADPSVGMAIFGSAVIAFAIIGMIFNPLFIFLMVTIAVLMVVIACVAVGVYCVGEEKNEKNQQVNYEKEIREHESGVYELEKQKTLLQEENKKLNKEIQEETKEIELIQRDIMQSLSGNESSVIPQSENSHAFFSSEANNAAPPQYPGAENEPHPPTYPPDEERPESNDEPHPPRTPYPGND